MLSLVVLSSLVVYVMLGISQAVDYYGISLAEGKRPTLAEAVFVGIFWPLYLNR